MSVAFIFPFCEEVGRFGQDGANDVTKRRAKLNPLPPLALRLRHMHRFTHAPRFGTLGSDHPIKATEHTNEETRQKFSYWDIGCFTVIGRYSTVFWFCSGYMLFDCKNG